MTTASLEASILDVKIVAQAYREARRRNGSARVRDFLPADDRPEYGAALGELVRVELEMEWAAGRRVTVADCLAEYPALADRPDALSDVAFAEYRQRLARGEDVDAAEYARYGVALADRPDFAAAGLDQTAVTAVGGGADALVVAANDYRQAASLAADLGATRLTLAGAAAADASHSSAGAVCPPPPFPAVGGEFLGFRLLKELGRGAFGRVYLARQDALAGRLVAVKVTADAGDAADEAQTLAQLQHANIVPVYSTHQAGRLRAVCMPYFGATTLADVLRHIQQAGVVPHSGLHLVSTLNQGKSQTAKASRTPADPGAPAADPPPAAVPIPAQASEILTKLADLSYVDAALWVVGRLADGLAHAHGRGVIHSDLKPANVLLTDDGQPMLLDFNLAAAARPDGAPTAHVGGTLPYMAPEHLVAFRTGHGGIDARSDVYALGLVLFELLTCRAAFAVPKGGFPGVLDEMIRQRRGECPPVRPLNPEVSPAVESIVRTCVHPDPARRYQTAADLRDDIDRHLADLPLAHAANPSVRERLQKWARRNPGVTSSSAVAGVAAAAVIAVGSSAYAWRERVRSLQAGRDLAAFRDDLGDARVQLYRTTLDPAALDDNLARCEAAAARYGILTDPRWADGPAVAYLPAADRDRLHADVGELLYLHARATGEKARLQADAAERARLAAAALDLSRKAGAEGGPAVARSTALQQGRLHALLGDARQAEPLLQAARGAAAVTAQDCYLSGQELAAAGEHAKALDLLDRATRLDPESFPAWFVRGNCYHALGQTDRAAECYSVCIALRKTYPQAWHNRGLARLGQHKAAEAVADFDEALRLDPTSADGYFDRGLARQQAGDRAGSLADLNHAIEAGNRRTRVFFARALVREEVGDAAGAAADRAAGMAATPADELSWLSRAQARLSGDLAGAAADVAEALRLNPVSRPGLQLNAHVLMEQGKPAEALAVLDRAVDLYPDHVPFRAGRGVLHARTGNRAAAVRDAQEALLRDTSPATVYQVAGVYARTAGESAEDRRESLRLLHSALDAGFGLDHVDADPELAPLRALPEFRRLVAAAKARAAQQKSQ